MASPLPPLISMENCLSKVFRFRLPMNILVQLLPHAEPHTQGQQGMATASLVGVSDAAPGFQALVFVPRELDKVSAVLSNGDIKPALKIQTASNADATRERVIQFLVDSDLFHIACHGLFQNDRPDQSGMALIPRPNESPKC